MGSDRELRRDSESNKFVRLLSVGVCHAGSYDQSPPTTSAVTTADTSVVFQRNCPPFEMARYGSAVSEISRII